MPGGAAQALRKNSLRAAHAQGAVRPDLDLQRSRCTTSSMVARAGLYSRRIRRLSDAVRGARPPRQAQRGGSRRQVRAPPRAPVRRAAARSAARFVRGALHAPDRPRSRPSRRRPRRAPRSRGASAARGSGSRASGPTTSSAGSRQGPGQVRHGPALAEGGQPAAGPLHHHPVRLRRQRVDKHAESCSSIYLGSRPLLRRYAAKSAGSKQKGFTSRVIHGHIGAGGQRQRVGVAQTLRRALGTGGDRLHDRDPQPRGARDRGPARRRPGSCRRRCRCR